MHKGAPRQTPGIPQNRNTDHLVRLPGAGLSGLMVKAWLRAAASKTSLCPPAERLNQGFHQRVDPEGTSTDLLLT